MKFASSHKIAWIIIQGDSKEVSVWFGKAQLSGSTLSFCNEVSVIQSMSIFSAIFVQSQETAVFGTVLW